MRTSLFLALLIGPFLLSARPVAPAKAADPVAVLEFRLVPEAEKPGLLRVPILGTDETIAVEPEVLMDARAVASAKANLDAMGRPQIALTFTPEGAKTFAEITRKNVRRKLAMLADGKMLSAPVIQAEIAGGKAVVTGSLTMAKARQIADRINEVAEASRK
jgi:preprotein translocase subunit SecD